MSGILMDVFPELLTWTISLYPAEIDGFEPATIVHSVVAGVHHILCFVLALINGWGSIVSSEIIPLFRWSKFRGFVACANAFANICTIFGNLFMVDKRYGSLAIILVILLVFIIALFVIVSQNPKGHLERGGDNDAKKADGIHSIIIATTTKAEGRVRGDKEEIETKGYTGKKQELRGEEEESEGSHMKQTVTSPTVYSSTGAEDHTGKKLIRRKEDESGEVGLEQEEEEMETKDRTGNKELRLGGGEEKRRELLWMVRLLCMLLCFMKFVNKDMEMTNCLLFLSCSLGELALMMARLLHFEFDVVAPALEVVHRAFLVMGLLTAHTMAAELLGEYVLLLCMPELVAALAWLTIFLGSSDPASAVRTIETAVRKAELPLLCLVSILASILVPITRVTEDTDEAEGATDLLLGNMSSDIVAVLSSVILPSLCMLMLCQSHRQRWRGQTTAAPSSELEGAIRLLSLCRDGPCKALIIVFLAKQML